MSTLVTTTAEASAVAGTAGSSPRRLAEAMFSSTPAGRQSTYSQEQKFVQSRFHGKSKATANSSRNARVASCCAAV